MSATAKSILTLRELPRVAAGQIRALREAFVLRGVLLRGSQVHRAQQVVLLRERSAAEGRPASPGLELMPGPRRRGGLRHKTNPTYLPRPFPTITAPTRSRSWRIESELRRREKPEYPSDSFEDTHRSNRHASIQCRYRQQGRLFR